MNIVHYQDGHRINKPRGRKPFQPDVAGDKGLYLPKKVTKGLRRHWAKMLQSGSIAAKTEVDRQRGMVKS